jgi:hypothetical protein
MKEVSYNLKIKIEPFDKVIKLPNDYKKRRWDENGKWIYKYQLSSSSNDLEAGYFFIWFFSKRLVKCNDIVFIKGVDYMWSSDDKTVKNTIINLSSQI